MALRTWFVAIIINVFSVLYLIRSRKCYHVSSMRTVQSFLWLRLCAEAYGLNITPLIIFSKHNNGWICNTFFYSFWARDVVRIKACHSWNKRNISFIISSSSYLPSIQILLRLTLSPKYRSIYNDPFLTCNVLKLCYNPYKQRINI